MVKTTKDLVAADGKPLKLKVARALFRSRARAFGLALPLLAFILVGFIVPISLFMTNAFYDARFSTYMPKTTSVLKSWNGIDEPSERMFQALANKKINILVISTSEIKISVLIQSKNLKKSVELLHKEFSLSR